MSRSSRRMILPLRVLGSVSVKRISAGRASLPISVETCSISSCLSCSSGSSPALTVTKAQIVWPVDDRRLADLVVADERALDLHGREAVAADVDHVVHAPEDPEVALLVAPRAVAGEVHRLELAPVAVDVALRVAPDAAQHRRPGLAQHEVAALVRPELLAVLVHDRG